MKRKSYLLIVALLSVNMLVACGSTSETASYSAEYGYGTVTSDDAESSEGYTADYSYEDSTDYGIEGSTEYSYGGAADYDYASGTDASAKDAASFDGVTTDDLVSANTDSSRKIIYTADVSIESKDFAADNSSLKKLVSSNNGYFESTDKSGSAENADRYANYTVRIPADNYSDFMDSVGDIGSLVYSSSSAEDITSNYVDVEARISSLKTKLERLQELEAEADNVTDLLEIEDRINDTQYELESYEAQRKVYDDQVSYCTIYITIEEVKTYTPTQNTFLDRLKNTCEDSLSGFVDFLENVLFTIIHLLPFIILVAILILIVCIIRKKKGKVNFKFLKRKEKNN